jgi:putative hemolysin
LPLLITIILALILVNGLFVMAEMALVSARKGRLQAAADRGDTSARIALALIEHPNRYLSTTQLGITLATIVLGMYGEASFTDRIRDFLHDVATEHDLPLLERSAHAIATGVTVIILTFATILLAELIPKRLGLLHPEGLARLVARPMDILSRISAPLIHLLSWLTNLFLRFIPERGEADEQQAAKDEVKAILASGAESGVVQQAQQQLVERVFQLSERRVKSLMVPRNDIDSLDVSASAARVRIAVATSTHSHFPICDGDLDHLIGVVHVKDLVKHSLVLGGVGVMSPEGEDTINLRALARKPHFVPESATALRMLEQFKQRSTHIAFVLDEYGVLVGLVTLNDLVEAMLGQLPMPGAAAAPGAEEPLIVKRHDGSYLLDAMLPVGELKSLMGVEELPRQHEADFDTLGGFVIANLGRVPAIGDRFAFERFTFEVVDMDRTRVDRVMLDIQAVPESEQNEEA